MQFFCVIWGLLRVEDCSSIKHDPTQLFFTTLYPRCTSRRWWTWCQEKICTVKCISLVSCSNELYWSRTCIMNARILQTLKREHPSTILVKSTEKPVAVESTGRPVTVTSTSESKELPHSTVQQQDNTHKEGSQKLIHLFGTHPSREALKADLEKDQEFKPFSEKSKDMIRSMGNIGVLRDVPMTVQHTGRQALYTVLAERTCDLQTKNRKLNKDRFDVFIDF